MFFAFFDVQFLCDICFYVVFDVWLEFDGRELIQAG